MIELLPADIILVKGDNWFEKEIETITHSKYNHCAGVSLDGRLIEAQGGRKTGYVDISAYEGQADVYRIIDLNDKQREQVVRDVMKQIGNGYDYFAIAWELARYEFHIELPFVELGHTSICSTLWVIEGFRKNSIRVCDWIKYPSPGDIAIEKKFKYIGSY